MDWSLTQEDPSISRTSKILKRVHFLFRATDFSVFPRFIDLSTTFARYFSSYLVFVSLCKFCHFEQ